MRKKLLALLMCICMVMTLLPSSAVAGNVQEQAAGSDTAVSPMSVITPDRPEDYVTFLFYSGEELAGTQVVKIDGGELVQPATPAVPEGSCFAGWYEGDAPMQFGSIAGRYSGGETITVTAKYTDVFYVLFMTVDGTVYSTGEARADSWAVDTPDYRPQGQRVTGWFYIDGSGKAVDFNPGGTHTNVRDAIGRDVQVYPRVENCYWVSFNTTGGSKVGSVSVPESDTLELGSIEEPVRTGYKFKGWSLSENGDIVAGITPESDVTLYAVWESTAVKYTVVYWGENADDALFGTALGSETRTGLTGSTVTGPTSLPDGTANSEHFTYKDSDSAVISADGSTVINVRFSRNSYTLTFDLGNARGKSMTINGTTYTPGGTNYVLTAKFEQSIESLWPTASNFNSGSNFRGWSYSGNGNTTQTSKVVTLTANFCRRAGLTLNANYDADCLDHLNYMFESFDQSSPTGSGRLYLNGKYYDRSAAYSQDANSSGGVWNAKNITGMTPVTVKTERAGRNERNIYLYYNRNEYELKLNNYGEVKSEVLKYGAPLDGKGAVPARPAGFSANAQFKGWYTVPPEYITETTVPYDFTGKTMPLDGLIVYAYWVEKPVTLTVIGLDGTAAAAEVPIGTVISSTDVFKAVPTDGILRWVYEDLSEVNVNEAIFADTVIRAVPLGVQYGISYDTLTDAKITDESRYEFGSKARVMNGSGLEKDGMVFVCWTDGEHTYYPGSYVAMTEDVTLTAVYAARVTEVSLSYHANFAAAENADFMLDALTKNGAVTLLGYAETGLSERRGYEFAGWSTTPGAAAELQPGASVRLDEAGSNDLYAVWNAKDTGYKVEFYLQNTDLSYNDSPDDVSMRQGKTDSYVTVTDEDKLPKQNGRYVYDDAAGNVTGGYVDAEGTLTLRLYFRLDRVSYTVKYFWNGTEDNAAEPKTVDNITVGTDVRELPADIAGYTAVSSDAATLTLDADAARNIIVFYYYKNVTLTANGAEYVYDGSMKSVSGFTGAPAGADFGAISVGASGTDAGEYPACFSENTAGTIDATEKYIVTEVNDGRLVITPCTDEVVVTVIGNHAELPYSGAEQRVDGYTVSGISDLRYTTDCFRFTGSAAAAGVDADRYPMGISAGSFENISRNFTNVRFDVTDGYLDIKPLGIELTAGSASKEYDGSELTCGDYEISAGAFVEGEGLASVKPEGSQTLPGSSENVIRSYELKANTKAQNYVITLRPGTLTVSDRSVRYAISVEANSASKRYDGQPLTAEGFKSLEFTVDGHVYTVTGLSASLAGVNVSDSGDVIVTGTAKVLDAGGRDVTGQFAVSTVNGRLEISPRSLEFTSGSAAREYNGLPLTNDEVTVAGDGFADGESARFFVTGSRTVVGSSPNTFSYELAGGALAENYSITCTPGELVITPIAVPLVLQANDNEKLYDGTPLTGEQAGYTLASGALAAGDTLDVTMSGSRTDAGESPNTVKSIRVMRGREDVTSCYVFGESLPGTLKVKVRSVKLTSGGDEKVYDGTPLTNGIITVAGDGFAAGEGAIYDVTGSRTDVGESENKFTYTLTDGTNAANYEISTEFGMLRVTPVRAEIVVRAASAEKLYDGTALTDGGYTFTQNIIADGEVLEAVVEGSRTDAGESPNTVKSVRIMRGEADVTAFYTGITTEPGKLTVKPRSVTLTSESADKAYDGTALTRPDVTVTGDGFVEGEVSDIRATGSITEAGSVPNKIEFTKETGYKDGNYTVEYSEGTLTVTASKDEVVVYIKGASAGDKYDGTVKKAEGYEVTRISSELYGESDFSFAGSAEVSAADAGTYMMGLTAASFKNENGNFEKVTFVVTDGRLDIAPREVVLESATDEKEYDGTALTRPDVTVTGDGFVEGEVSDIRATGSITEAGSVDNDITFDRGANYKDKNYDITYNTGTLSIKKCGRLLRIEANDNTWEYDGKAHSDDGFTVYFGGESLAPDENGGVTLPTGDRLNVRVSGSVKHTADTAAGNNTIVSFELENGEQYARVETANGTLTITAKPLKITAGSAGKIYDGTPLTCGSYTSTPLADGDRFDSVTVTGSITNAGTAPNVASDAVIKSADGDVTADYAITYDDGELVVRACEDAVIVTITEHGGSYMYDGEEKTAEGYDVSVNHAVYSETDFEFGGTARVSGTNAGSYEMQLAAENFRNVNPNFTDVSFVIVDNALEISKRSLKMTSADDEKVYDGTPLTNDEITVTGDGFADGEGAIYDVTGSRTNAGESENKFTYTLNDGTNAENYIIETAYGMLTVRPVKTPVTITAASDEKLYDGAPLTNGGYEYTEGVLVPGDTLTAVVEGSITNAGSSANVVKSYRVMRGETDVTANYTFAETVDGTLTVKPRSLTMTSAGDEKVYDGTPLTNDEIIVAGDGFADGEGAIYDVTGSQTNVGESENKFTYTLTDGTNAGNYVIRTEYGMLKVLYPTQAVVITAGSGEKLYDGSPLTAEQVGYTCTGFVISAADTLIVELEGSRTDAGESASVVRSYRVMRGGEDVTANYVFADPVDGVLKVTKRQVTITSGTASKLYDGEYLTCDKISVTGDGFADGEGADYDITGRQKEVGVSDNEFTYTLWRNTKAENYEISIELGRLYVRDKSEKPKTGDGASLLLLMAAMAASGATGTAALTAFGKRRKED